MSYWFPKACEANVSVAPKIPNPNEKHTMFTIIVPSSAAPKMRECVQFPMKMTLICSIKREKNILTMQGNACESSSSIV